MRGDGPDKNERDDLRRMFREVQHKSRQQALGILDAVAGPHCTLTQVVENPNHWPKFREELDKALNS